MNRFATTVLLAAVLSGACGTAPDPVGETRSALIAHITTCTTSPRAGGYDLPAVDIFDGLAAFSGNCRRIVGDVSQGYTNPGFLYGIPAGDPFVIHSARMFQQPVVPTTTPPGYVYVCDLAGMSYPGCARSIAYLNTSPGTSYPKQISGISSKGVVVGYTPLSPAPAACPTVAVTAGSCGTMSPWGLPNYIGGDATAHNVAQTFSPCTGTAAGMTVAFNFTCDQALD